jgi:dihydroorotate dehydrogenase (NAD+) catalytic subunit
MINAVGIPSVGIERFMVEQLPRFEDIGTKVVLSLSGNAPQHYFESLEIVNDDPRVASIELNLSCPNVGSGLAFSANAEALKEVVDGARKRTKLPLYVKISPNVTDIRVTALAAQECGADAVTVSNTWRAMKIDINKGKPVLGNISGGMSGPAIKPQNMFLVYQTAGVLDIPVIACGGITTWQDAIEYIMAGATALQVGCVNFVNPMAMVEIIRGMEEFMDAKGIKSLDEIRGIAQPGK